MEDQTKDNIKIDLNVLDVKLKTGLVCLRVRPSGRLLQAY
jgi:hypothetical protein